MTEYKQDNITEEGKSSLVLKNITVMGRRTSIRLEPEMWRELKDVADREDCSIHDICTLISIRKNKKTSLTAAIRVFLMLYYRAAATEQGHVKAGHGDFQDMKRRAGMASDWSALKARKEADREEITKRLARQLDADNVNHTS
jgi:predicted DNA-binding ribbon-helix-helix protein